ncbi:MAG TPA: arsenic resistance N-acetyltransferase ArsN2 [Chitinophagaceae bacterium]|nr:arsenic resistance N-acetyltransferase ArsN2 [Chitinophagaceae bacterium]
MNITTITQNNFSSAIALLKRNNLPTEDISDNTGLFVLEEENKVVGTIALEHDATDALLRSLSVTEEKRNMGLGKELVAFIEDHAQKQGVKNIYLLTTTAANFFSKGGYQVTDRNDVSDFIKKTSEFCSVCPASATVMKKELK